MHSIRLVAKVKKKKTGYDLFFPRNFNTFTTYNNLKWNIQEPLRLQNSQWISFNCVSICCIWLFALFRVGDNNIVKPLGFKFWHFFCLKKRIFEFRYFMYALWTSAYCIFKQLNFSQKMKMSRSIFGARNTMKQRKVLEPFDKLFIINERERSFECQIWTKKHFEWKTILLNGTL